MTIREYWLNRKRSYSRTFLTIVPLLCVLALLIHWDNPFIALLLGFGAIGLAFGNLLCINQIKCPACKKPMRLLTLRPATRRRIGSPICCRNCGVNIDARMPP
jgi:hypothetical protein